MQFSCDPHKSRANYFKHGIVLEFAQYLDWTKEVVWQDDRQNYNEVRMSGLVPLEGKVYAVVYVLRAESTRMISLRKANKREAKHYEKNQ
ncbi:MAG: BrnT family toxin [Betaproteobacteria bacterium]|jgi:uncharacterized DUF497 family protein